MNGRVLFCLLSFLTSVALAQDRPIRALTPELAEIWQKHAVRADGSTNPLAVPYGIAMERAFWRFADEVATGEQPFRQQVRMRFPASDADVERIAEIASQSRSFSAAVRDEASHGYDEVCAEIVGVPLETLNALAVAERLTAIADAEAARLDAFYSEAVASLSALGRSGLESYVDAEVRPRMRWGQDLIGLAAEVPQAFLSLRRHACERRLNRPENERGWRVERIPQPVGFDAQ